jgi:hypothetical protein
MLLPIALNSLLPGGNFLLQLFKRLQNEIAVQLEDFGFVYLAYSARAYLCGDFAGADKYARCHGSFLQPHRPVDHHSYR